MMNRLLRSLSVVALVCPPPGLDVASAQADPACGRAAIGRLRAGSPEGFAIYKRVGQPGFFEGWLRCDDPQYGLPTAVHESTHAITAETDAFPLVGGGAVERPHEASAFFPPYKIAKSFKADDFVSIYLRRGKASAATDFLDLLDELNAYTHDLATAVDLKDLKAAEGSVDHRDGLAAMMSFVAGYAETARTKEPQTWRGLQRPQVTATIAQLWTRAERVMASSCGIVDFGRLDKRYVARLCTLGGHAALAQIIGRAPACAAACLNDALDGERTGDRVALHRE